MRKLNLVWMDDDFNVRPSNFNPVFSYIKKFHTNLQVIKCNSVQEFSNLLKDRHHLNLLDVEYIDFIWLDVMIKPLEKKPTFAALGFGNLMQRAMDVGSQILDLMQNPERDLECPPWLTAYRGRPTTLFTTKTDILIDWASVVPKEVRVNTELFSVLVKELSYGSNNIDPDQVLKDHLTIRINQCCKTIDDYLISRSVP